MTGNQCLADKKRQKEARSFNIHQILGDGQFEHTRKHIEHMGIILNMTSLDEHVPEIERNIRTIKESVQATVNLFPLVSQEADSGNSI